MNVIKKLALVFLISLPMHLMAKECPSHFFAIGGGCYNLGRRNCAALQLEYRGACYFRYLRPQLVFLTPKFQAFFLGAGISLELDVFKRLFIIPSFAPGYYHRGSGKNLGYPLEFKSSLELAYEWTNRMRLGLQVYHISNAGLGKRNPGVNGASLLLSIPICMMPSS